MLEFKFRRLEAVAIMPINDLQWRAMWLVTLRGMSYEEVGKLLFISERSVRRYVEHFFSTGNA